MGRFTCSGPERTRHGVLARATNHVRVDRARQPLPRDQRGHRLAGGLATHLGLRLERATDRRSFGATEQRTAEVDRQVRAASAGGLAIW